MCLHGRYINTNIHFVPKYLIVYSSLTASTLTVVVEKCFPHVQDLFLPLYVHVNLSNIAVISKRTTYVLGWHISCWTILRAGNPGQVRRSQYQWQFPCRNRSFACRRHHQYTASQTDPWTTSRHLVVPGHSIGIFNRHCGKHFISGDHFTKKNR